MTSLGVTLTLGGNSSGFSPTTLFANGERGLIWNFSAGSTLYSDAGTTPAVIDGVIGQVNDQSPNGVAGTQVTGVSKPLWKSVGGKTAALFDGSNDSFSTAAIDLSGTNKVTIFAGIQKLSNAGAGCIVELSTTVGNVGTFLLDAPDSASGPYGLYAKGTSQQGAVSANFTAPDTAVLTGLVDISTAPQIVLRRNGVQIASNSGGLGSGNFGAAYPLYVGRRAGTSIPFNGYIYALIIVGRKCTAAEIASTEAWINARTGAY